MAMGMDRHFGYAQNADAGADTCIIAFGGFSCRNCAKLNYRSQQESKDSMRYYRKGMELVNKHLIYSGPAPDGFEFPYFIPDRPKGMHQSTYRRYLLRFLRYREKHTSRLIRDIGRLL